MACAFPIHRQHVCIFLFQAAFIQLGQKALDVLLRIWHKLLAVFQLEDLHADDVCTISLAAKILSRI